MSKKLTKKQMANLWVDVAEDLETRYVKYICNAIHRVLDDSPDFSEVFHKMVEFAGIDPYNNRSGIPDEWRGDEATEYDDTRILFALFMAIQCDPNII